MYPVSELACCFQLPFLVLLHCLSACIPACLLAGSFSFQVAVYVTGCVVTAPRPSGTQLKERHHQLASRGAFPTSAARPKTLRSVIIRQLWPWFSASAWEQQHATMPSWWPWDLERFWSDWNNAAQLPLPLYGHKSGHVPSCPSCSLGSQTAQWKLSHKSKSMGQLFPLTAFMFSSLPGLHSFTKHNK